MLGKGFYRKQSLTVAILLVVLLAVGGCSTVSYYHQAAVGQIDLLLGRQKISDALLDPSISDAVKAKLKLAEQLRMFAAEDIGLPVGDTFSSYVDTGKPYVVWNVFSAEAFASQLHTLCYPIAGCVGYKGFFAEADAKQFADQQAAADFDVYLGGVAAYSSLGWFDDPLINTFMHYPDTSLASLVFHELAHKVLYLKGDTVFNESFATAIERYALARWMASRDQAGEYAAYLETEERKQAVVTLILGARNDLQVLYASAAFQQLPKSEKLTQKARRIQQLKADYYVLMADLAGTEYQYWMQSDINNAKLAATGAYHDWVASFENLLQQSGSYEAFVIAATALSELDEAERRAQLEALR